MSSVIACPNCRLDVTVPPAIDTPLLCPHCYAEFTLQPVLQQAPPEAMAAGAGYYGQEPADQVPADPGVADAQAAVAAAEAAPADDVQVAVNLSSAQRATPGVGRSSAAHRASNKGPGLIGHLVGIFGGGLLGLAVGYYLLNWLWGPQFNFLNIPLPGLSRTRSDDSPPLTFEPDPPGRRTSPSPTEPEEPPLRPQPQVPGGGSSAAGQPAGTSPSSAAGTKLYSAEELAEALKAANGALGCAACNSTGMVFKEVVTGRTEVNGKVIEQKSRQRVTCDVCNGRPAKGITPESFEKLCAMAHVLTNVNPSDPGIFSRREGVEIVLRRAADEKSKVQNLGRQAGDWLARSGRPNDGIVLVGTVNEVRREGDWGIIKLVLFGSPKPVIVVSPAGRIPFQPQEKVLIAGSIVDQPRQTLQGYSGAQTQVVRGGLPMRLPIDF